ncbi:MAG: DsrE family protein [Thermodesulfovibrionales bacterium]|nr:DsrE family protein [Thermodesulfovibrionales bacterium]
MKNVAIILRRPPYGDINAAEAVRHAMGGASDDLSVSLILMDAGVLILMAGQDVSGTGFTNLGEALTDCLDMGVSVYAERQSMRQHRLDSRDIPERVRQVNGYEIAEIIKVSDTTMIF